MEFDSRDPKQCWICGGEGTTGEHKSKRSDMHAVLGKPTQAKPVYLHDREKKNRQVGSLDNKRLKSEARLCPKCNNERSQPYDRAWEHLSDELRNRRPPIVPGSFVRANKIFTYDTRARMVEVHLFFVKLFGCLIVEGGVPIDVSGFADAFMNAKPHRAVYLRFGIFQHELTTVGRSDLATDQLPDGSCAFASWFYYVDWLSVHVMYALDGEKREGLVGAWHPRFGTNKLVIHDFESV